MKSQKENERKTEISTIFPHYSKNRGQTCQKSKKSRNGTENLVKSGRIIEEGRWKKMRKNKKNSLPK